MERFHYPQHYQLIFCKLLAEREAEELLTRKLVAEEAELVVYFIMLPTQFLVETRLLL
jgi:hypothetical protein